MRVLVFGASITYGAWDSEGGWVDRLKREQNAQTLESKGQHKVQIINLGVGGDTSTKVLARMENEILARKSETFPLAFVISFGTNDGRTRDGKVETSPEDFAGNTRQIISKARQYSDKILFVGTAPLSQETVVLKGNEYSDSKTQEYDTVLRGIVEAEGLPFVSVREAFADKDMTKLFCYDGLHPNDEGHKLMAETIRPKVLELLK